MVMEIAYKSEADAINRPCYFTKNLRTNSANARGAKEGATIRQLNFRIPTKMRDPNDEP